MSGNSLVDDPAEALRQANLARCTRNEMVDLCKRLGMESQGARLKAKLAELESSGSPTEPATSTTTTSTAVNLSITTALTPSLATAIKEAA